MTCPEGVPRRCYVTAPRRCMRKSVGGPAQADAGGSGKGPMELCGGGDGWFLYYAYGSNLLRERLLLRNPSASLCALARLQVRRGGGAAGGEWGKSACPGGATRGPGSATWGPALQGGRSPLPVAGFRRGRGGSVTSDVTA